MPLSSVPSGHLLCNGVTYSSVIYPLLFSYLGSTNLPLMGILGILSLGGLTTYAFIKA